MPYLKARSLSNQVSYPLLSFDCSPYPLGRCECSLFAIHTRTIGTVIEPLARILAHQGEIIIGPDCILSENVLIENKSVWKNTLDQHPTNYYLPHLFLVLT